MDSSAKISYSSTALLTGTMKHASGEVVEVYVDPRGLEAARGESDTTHCPSCGNTSNIIEKHNGKISIKSEFR